MVRGGAESRTESLLRLLLIDAGLPEPELNRELFDSRDLTRIDRSLAATWTVVRLWSWGLFQRPAETVARVSAALAG
jgi:hypothetical protein